MFWRRRMFKAPLWAFRASASSFGATSSTVPKPSGVVVGDVVFVIIETSGVSAITTNGGASWVSNTINWSDGSGTASTIHWKLLDQIDIANAWTLNTTREVLVAAYQTDGAGTVAVRNTANNDTGANLTLSGFTPNDMKAAVTIIVDKDTSGSFTAPTNFTMRANWIGLPKSVAIADRALYAGGNVVWGAINNVSPQIGWLIEVGNA